MASNIVIRPVTKNDLKTVAEISGQVDLTEPMNAETEAMVNESRKFLDLSKDNIIQDDLSFLAFTQSGTPVGVLVALDFASEMSPEYIKFASTHPMFSEFHKMEDTMHETYAKSFKFERKTFPKGHTVTVNAAGTILDFRNQGIEMKIFSTALEAYKKRNYKYATMQSYSEITEQISKKFQFKGVTKSSMPAEFGPGSTELMKKEL